MFNLKQTAVSIYNKVEQLFLSEENLEFLSKKTGMHYRKMRLPQFISTNLGLVQYTKSAEENVEILNKKFLSGVLGERFVKHNESVVDLFISPINVKYLLSMYMGRLSEKKVISLIHGFTSNAMEMLEDGEDDIQKLFSPKTDSYAQLRRLNRAFLERYNTTEGEHFTTESYQDRVFREENLAPPGYESLNDKEVYNNRDYPSQFIDEPDPEIADLRDLFGRDDDKTRPRFMRYQEIPFWQHTKRGVWQDEEYTRETLGASDKEHVQVQRKYKVPKTRYDTK